MAVSAHTKEKSATLKIEIQAKVTLSGVARDCERVIMLRAGWPGRPVNRAAPTHWYNLQRVSGVNESVNLSALLTRWEAVLCMVNIYESRDSFLPVTRE